MCILTINNIKINKNNIINNKTIKMIRIIINHK